MYMYVRTCLRTYVYECAYVHVFVCTYAHVLTIIKVTCQPVRSPAKWLDISGSMVVLPKTFCKYFDRI